MTEQIVRVDLLEAPETTPLFGTLLDHVTPIESINWQAPSGAGLFESFNCLTTDRRATWPCPFVYAAPPVQAAATTATTGGTVAAGTYLFKITALNANGETLPSNEVSRVTTGATSTITVNWAAVPGATGYRIYATNGATNTEKLLIEVGNVLTYTWTGTPAIGTANPPTTNSAQVIDTKVFTNPSWPTGQRFAIYTGVTCKRFDGEAGQAHMLAEAGRIFEARESFGVERATIETVLQGATDITPAAGAVGIHAGIGLLEGDAAKKYAGVPTFHATRTVASMLATYGGLDRQGSKLFTMLGSKVAAGGGYDASNISPAGVAAPAGEQWLYASGEVVVLRGDLISKDQLDRTTNDLIDLVERPYIVSVDCYKSAIRVKVA